jgi:hypothetical protein
MGAEPEQVRLEDVEGDMPAGGVSGPNDPAPPAEGPEQVQLQKLEKEETPAGAVSVPPYLARLGFHLTIALVGLILFVFFWVGLYGWLTYPPSLDELDARFTTDAEAAAKTYTDLRTAWTNNVKDLLQILVISLLIPLLATVIGYIFGRREAQEEQ